MRVRILNARDVVFFFGAGASAPFGIPTMKQFVVDFDKFLDENGTEDEKTLYGNVKNVLAKRLKREVDLENIFTVIDGYINFSFEKLGVLSLYTFREQFSKMNKIPPGSYEVDVTICRSLRKKFQEFVREKCLIPDKSFQKIANVYHDLFNRFWYESSVKGSGYPERLNFGCCDTWTMFTTNYDTCLEYYWRQVAKFRLNTGFVVDEARNTWTLNPSKLYEERLRLLKLHGSISWRIEPDGTVTEEQSMLGRSLMGRKFVGEMMIYPVEEKELYIDPYISMFVQLNRELKHRSMWVIIGYSFNDPVIREIFKQSSDNKKTIVLVHPSAQKVKDQMLSGIKGKRFHPIHRKFGNYDFRQVNHEIIQCFKPNPKSSPAETPV